jgi:hypothetical protein
MSVNAVSGSKPYWQTETPDPSVTTADKVENQVAGDKYDYKDTTKAGVDAASLEGNLKELGGILLDKGLGKIAGNGMLLAKLGKFIAEEAKALQEGKKTKAEVAGDVGVFVAKELGSKLASGLGGDASIAYTMLKAIFLAVPKAIEAQKGTEQLWHDEGIRLVVAEHFKGQMPGATYASVEKDMSTFGKTFRNTATFGAQVKAFEGASKAQPALGKAIDQRFWMGKCAALELGLKSKADLERMLDPKNGDPRAIAFRKSYTDPSNLAFRLGAQALVDEASLGTPEANDLYAKDWKRWKDEQSMCVVSDLPKAM